MLKHLLVVLALCWSTVAAAEFDDFQSAQGGTGPKEEVTVISITVILSPSDEETTRICGSKSPAAGCYYEDNKGNGVLVIPSAEGWDDFYSMCIAGHELYHALGADHATGIGCPYPYVDENNVARGGDERSHNNKKEEPKKENKKQKKNKK